MIALIQRVKEASVSVGKNPVSSIGRGLLVFLGVAKTDTPKDASKLAEKIINFRIMEDQNGKMNRSVGETGGEILIVSQFTLCANVKGGRRPDFFPAMEPIEAKALYEHFTQLIQDSRIAVKTGSYSSRMEVGLVNDGPVTFILDSSKL